MSELIDLGVDFETYYTQTYSLSVLTTPEYILHRDFEAIGVGLILQGAQPAWYSGDYNYLQSVLHTIDWSRTRVIAHNAMFDGAILEWIFGCKPAKYMCSMMGARPHYAPYAGGASLATLARYFGFPAKGTAVHKFKGWRRRDFDVASLQEYGDYCVHDARLSCRIAQEKVDRVLPADEHELIDLTIKKFTRPILQLRRDVLVNRLSQLELKRQDTLLDLHNRGLGIDEDGLRSRTVFSKKLKDLGVEPPKKKSKTTGEETLAFAKDDLEFVALKMHPNRDVRALVEAKLLFSSNQETTRINRLIGIHDCSDPPLLPVPLVYYGAHTGRFSGFDSINLQNLNRVDPDNPDSGVLRKAIIAPEGYKIIAADLSNIEARIVATLAGQWDLVQQFADKMDPYSIFASRIYGRPITKANKTERFVGKTCILGLGYGMGAARFLFQMQLAKVPMTLDQAKKVVYLYRDTYSAIPKLWSHLEAAVRNTCPQPGGMFAWNCLSFLHERILLPNGMPIMYPGVKLDSYGALGFDGRFGKKKKAEDDDIHFLENANNLWGGTICENVVQAMARIILTRAEIRLAKLGLKAALQVHDELVYCVPETHVPAVKHAVEIAMTDRVDWMPKLPIAVEIGVGDAYGGCK